MNGAEFVVECLKKEGVRQLFGYPGGAVIPLYDALYNVSDIKHIRPCHEQGAIHAADGYARATGNIGVCIATSGPGATNILTGLATAYIDSIPLVVITGQVGSGMLGKDSFQEVDITGMTMSCTKHNMLVKEADELGAALAEAFYMAKEGRPGPVLVDITKSAFVSDVTNLTYSPKKVFAQFDTPESNIKLKKQLDKLVELINNNEKVVVYAGGGIISGNHSQALRAFIQHSKLPLCNSLMGLGSYDRTDLLSYGIVGMHGDVAANELCYHADVIVGIGVRFSDRAIGHRNGFSKQAHLVHIDIDDSEFGKNVDSVLNIKGDYSAILAYLMSYILPKGEDWSRKTLPEAEKSKPQKLMEQVASYMPADTIVVTDVGQHQMWAAKYWTLRYPRTFITSGGFGTMGFGMGAAMGVKCGKPTKEVILITGDGSFRMNQHELLTLSKYKIPVTVLLLNNHTLGMVRQWQAMFQQERYSETDVNDGLDVKLLCAAYGVNYAYADDDESLRIAFEERDAAKITVIEYLLDKDERVYPIVPAGGGVHEYIMKA